MTASRQAAAPGPGRVLTADLLSVLGGATTAAGTDSTPPDGYHGST